MLRTLDIRTLSFLSTAASLLLALAMFLVGRISRRNPAIGHWVAGAAFGALGFTLIGLRALLPDLLSIVIANALLVAGLAGMHCGLRLALGLPPGRRWDISAGLLVAAACAWYTYAMPSLAARIVVVSTLLAVVALASARLLLADGAARRDPNRTALAVVGIAYLGVGAVMALRAAMTLLAPPAGDLMVVAGDIHKLAFLALIALMITLTFGLAFVVASRTERGLLRSEQRFRTLFEQAPIGIVMATPEGVPLRVNTALEQMLGRNEDELRRQSFHDWTHPDDLAASVAAVERMRKGEADELTLEKRYLRSDGSIVWALTTLHAARDSEGGLDYFVVMAADITARKDAERRLDRAHAAELEEQQRARIAALNLVEDARLARRRAEDANAELRESETRFHDIVRATADWVWETDAEGRFDYASDSVFDLLGYTPAEMIGRTPFDFMPPDEAERVAAEYAAIAARREPFRDLDNVNVHKDGHLIHVSTNGMPILDAAGNLLGYRGLDRDVSEQKQAELVQHRLAEEMSATLQAIPDLLFEIDEDGRYLRVMAAHQELLAAPEEQVLGRTVRDILPAAAAQTVMDALAAAARSGSDYGRSIELQLSAGLRQFELSVAMMAEKSGELRRFVVLSRDITERKQAELELKQRNEELERFNRATVGRELDMVELKKAVNALSRQLGREPPYPLAFLDDTHERAAP